MCEKVFPALTADFAADFWKTLEMFRVFLALVVITVCTSPAKVDQRVGGYLPDGPGHAKYKFGLPNSSSPHSPLSEVVPCYPQLGDVHISRNYAPVQGRSDFFLVPVVVVMLSCLTLSVLGTGYCAGKLLTASFIQLLHGHHSTRNTSG